MTLLLVVHSASRMFLDINLYSVLSDIIKDNVNLEWSETKLNYACFGAQGALVVFYAIIMGQKCWQKRLEAVKTDDKPE